MTTTVKIVDKRHLGSGAVAIRLRPNDDAAHDSVHTLYVTARTRPEDVEAWLADAKDKVAALYEAQLAAVAHLESL